MKTIVFGMDGNVLDNYSVKANSAGESLVHNAKAFFQIEKPVSFFADIYVETSGKNSLEQFRIAYERIGVTNVANEVLEKTEKDFRSVLQASLEQSKVFPDAQRFLQRAKGKYRFAITTTVPVHDIEPIVKSSGLGVYIDVVCARHGYFENGIVHEVAGLDKGWAHYNLLLEKYNLTKNDLVAVSSTKQDIQNAKDFGIRSIAVGHIFSVEELQQTGADEVLLSFDELDQILL
jgi:phosphoglycolate phosphatase-like HAD superfamily hydrolase